MVGLQASPRSGIALSAPSAPPEYSPLAQPPGVKCRSGRGCAVPKRTRLLQDAAGELYWVTLGGGKRAVSQHGEGRGVFEFNPFKQQQAFDMVCSKSQQDDPLRRIPPLTIVGPGLRALPRLVAAGRPGAGADFLSGDLAAPTAAA